jgi:hypothetical protein
MSTYRKKPVTVEARQFKDLGKAGLNQMLAHEIGAWISGTEDDSQPPFPEYGSNYIIIETLEGDMTAKLGDYIICGIQGEFYPCKPDIFEATYELVSDD